MLEFLEKENKFVGWDKLGKIEFYEDGLKDHFNSVLKMKFLDLPGIKERKFKVLLDCVNGAGSHSVPRFLKELGCEVIEMNCEKTGIFPRLPEPIPENLTETMNAIKTNNVDLGIVVDPDVDRLVLLTEKGEPFGEENTITQAVKFILSKEKGNVVVNLSTTRAVDDAAAEHGCKVFRSPVGEANVVQKMKEVDAVIGGEGSGGVIYPDVVFGRDAITGIVITLQHLLEFGGTMSELKAALPQYFILKNKIDISGKEPDAIIDKLKEKFVDNKPNIDDGLRIDFEDHWVHFRKSNTEPIIRCIVEGKNLEQTKKYIDEYFAIVKELV
jgi:phosphomannomutase